MWCGSTLLYREEEEEEEEEEVPWVSHSSALEAQVQDLVLSHTLISIPVVIG